MLLKNSLFFSFLTATRRTQKTWRIQCANMRTGITAFKATGIWPTDPSIFKEEDFLPADVTNIPVEIPPSQEPSPNIPVKKGHSVSSNEVDEDFSTDKEQTSAKKTRLNDRSSVPGCSH